MEIMYIIKQIQWATKVRDHIENLGYEQNPRLFYFLNVKNIALYLDLASSMGTYNSFWSSSMLISSSMLMLIICNDKMWIEFGKQNFCGQIFNCLLR